MVDCSWHKIVLWKDTDGKKENVKANFGLKICDYILPTPPRTGNKNSEWNP